MNDTFTKIERIIYYPVALASSAVSASLWSHSAGDAPVKVAATVFMIFFWVFPFFRSFPVVVLVGRVAMWIGFCLLIGRSFLFLPWFLGAL